MLTVENLKKSFGEKSVLRGFSAVFPEKEITCIMGRSGSGKTTLLRILAGLLPADAGTIDGKPDRVAFLFQEDRLCEDFSALRNVRLVTGNRVSKAEIRRHLQLLGVDEEGPVSAFSGGMKRRVALVRTLLYDAPLILMDEPFKGLDGETKKRVIDYVRTYAKNATVLCVTHDAEEAEALGARILEMEALSNTR